MKLDPLPRFVLGPRRPADCLSDLALDRFRLREFDGTPQAASIEYHLQQCEACRARISALEAEGAPDLAAMDRLRQALEKPPEPRQHRWNWLSVLWETKSWRWLSAATAAGVATVLFLTVVAPKVRPAAPTNEGVKGDHAWRLRVYVAKGSSSTAPVAPGQRLSPGDKIRFEVTTYLKAGYAAVVSLDSRGLVTPFAPVAGQGLLVKGRTPTLLPEAIELDDSLGPERLVLLGCSKPVPVEEILAAARRALLAAKGRPDAVSAVQVAGCTEDSLLIHKERKQ